MRVILCLFITMLMMGCVEDSNRPAPPPPSISVQRTESPDGVVLKITFEHHIRDHHGSNRWSEPYTSFNQHNLEQLAIYKKQLEFVLVEIDEFEKRAKIHEPQRNTPVP